MALGKLDIGEELGKGWELFKPNMSVLVVAGLISVVVSGVTCLILLGPMMAGMLMVVQRLLQNDPVKPQAGDVFKGLDCFVQSLLLVILSMVAGVVLGMIPVVGQLAGIVIGAFMIWAMMFVVFQKLTAIDALKKVFEYTKSGDFTMPLVFAVVVNIISGLGAIACIVGVFFTMPLAYCMFVHGYQSLFSANESAATPAAGMPPTPTPPSDLRL